ncbi:MAG: hypothetical protein PUE08_06185 [Eubacteriales bacterium]|nr:hypothetical protein [Eubacteriales bacterium]
MKRKLTAIFLSSAIVLTVGISVAYYNTKTFGFDENAKIFSYDKEKFSFLDFNIYYKDVEDFIAETRTYIPDKPTIISANTHYNVVGR